MRRNTAPSRVSIVFCILLCMAFSANPGFAQNEAASQQLYSFSYFQVQPGMDFEFEALIKDMIPVLKEMGVTEMQTLRASNFGMWGRYLFISPLMEGAAMDANLSKQLSDVVPATVVSLFSRMSQSVVSCQDIMLIPMPDLNIAPPDDYEAKLIGHVTIGTVPGRDEDFKKGIKKVIDAMGKTNVKGVVIGQVGHGGNMDDYIMFVFYDSFKEMLDNEPAIQREFSKADLTSLTGVVTSRESEVFVRIPELCFEAPAQ